MFDNHRHISPNLFAPVQKYFVLSLDDNFSNLLPIITVLDVVAYFVTGYLQSRTIVLYQYFTVRNTLPVHHWIIWIVWSFLWLKFLINNLLSSWIIPYSCVRSCMLCNNLMFLNKIISIHFLSACGVLDYFHDLIAKNNYPEMDFPIYRRVL